ncbi:MAG TPA: DinB family protein [Gemmatimonas sp.]|nr:DinB family protein [Gemmatimonas sp.]
MDFELDSAIAVLERTPRTLRVLLDGLPDGWTTGNEGPNTWSPHEVVAHLRHADRTIWLARAVIIRDHGEAMPFPEFDREGQRLDGIDMPLSALLDTFDEVRTENIRVLRSWQLDETDFARTGVHPAFGVVTMRQLLATWVAHDLSHITQIVRVMAKQYRKAVGP